MKKRKKLIIMMVIQLLIVGLLYYRNSKIDYDKKCPLPEPEYPFEGFYPNNNYEQ